MKACPFCYQRFPDDVGFCPFHGAELRDVIDWKPAAREGAEVGGYMLEKCVGTDALGEVYRAHKGKQQFHVRLFFPHVTVDGMRVIRMLDDFERLKAAKHPALVRVVKADRLEDETVYAVREWLEGESLREVIKRRRYLEPAEAAPILRLALDGLKALHDLDVIHGFLSPDSIFIERASNGKSTVRLVDAALWRVHLVDNPNEVAPENVELYAATADYLAPEAIEGKELRRGADIYSAGIVFFELMTGRTPFASPTAAATFKRHLAEDPVPATLARPDLVLPDGLQDLLASALAKTPDSRFASAEAFRNALSAVLPPSGDEQDGYLPADVLPPPELALQKGKTGRHADEASPRPTAQAAGDDALRSSSAAAVVARAAEVSAAKASAGPADNDKPADAAADTQDARGRGKKSGSFAQAPVAKKGKRGGKGAKGGKDVEPEGADGSITRTEPRADEGEDSAVEPVTGAEPVATAAKPDDAPAVEKKPTLTAEEARATAPKTDKGKESSAPAAKSKDKRETVDEEAIDLDAEEPAEDSWFSATGGDDLSHRALDYDAEQYARRSSRVTTFIVIGAVVAVAAAFVLWVATFDDETIVDEEALAEQQAAADREAKRAQFLSKFDAAINGGDFTSQESAYVQLIELRRLSDDAEFEALRERFLSTGRQAAQAAQASAAAPATYFDDYTLTEVRRRAASVMPAADSGAPLAARGEALVGATFGFVHGTVARVSSMETTRSHFEAWTTASVIWGRLSELAANPQDEEAFRTESARAALNARFFEDRIYGEPTPPPTDADLPPKTGQASTSAGAGVVTAQAAPDGPPASAAPEAELAPGEAPEATPVLAAPAVATAEPVAVQPEVVSEPSAKDAGAVVDPKEQPAPQEPPAPREAAPVEPEPKPDASPTKPKEDKPSPEPKAEASAKGDPEALTEQGFTAINAGNLKEARTAFEAALKAKAGHPRALFGLGEVAWDEKDFARSAEFYLKAAEKASNNAAYRIKLGNSYIKLQRYQDALEAYQTAESIARDDKTREHAQKGIAIAKRKLGQ